jgi:hypothetical protein
VKTWFGLVWNTVKVFLAFTCCTVLFYYGLVWVNQEYEDYHRYDEPEGKAVKVFQMSELDEVHSSWLERLKLFYDIGE